MIKGLLSGDKHNVCSGFVEVTSVVFLSVYGESLVYRWSTGRVAGRLLFHCHQLLRVRSAVCLLAIV